jgi:hypothetical protein
LVESDRDDMYWTEEYRGPKILAKLFGTERLDDFKLQTEFNCDLSTDKEKAARYIPRLKECIGLEKITLGDYYDERLSFLTDEMLAELSPLTGLQSLDIPCSKFTDAGMETISRFPGLKVLKIPGTSITNCGVRLLESLPLEVLILTHAQIDDAAAESFLRMKDLADLNVSETRLTDKSVPSLEQLPHLNSLDISGTEITEEGYHELEAKLPDCMISYQ